MNAESSPPTALFFKHLLDAINFCILKTSSHAHIVVQVTKYTQRILRKGVIVKV